MPDAYPHPIDIELDHADHSVDTDALASLIRRVVDAEGGTLRYVSVVLTGHDTVGRLNRQYLDHDYETDVLAFSLADPLPDDVAFPDDPASSEDASSEDTHSEDADAPDENVVEGEVYVDLDTAAERHGEFDATFEEEVRRYVVHGVLHLLGYDDRTETGNAEMRRLEDEYLGNS